MKTIITFFALFTFSFLSHSQNSATYTITFESVWSQNTHPHASGSLPGNAHWSKLVGATHNDQTTFWELGGIATTGVEMIAESGINTAFESEVNQAINNSVANRYIDGPQLNASEGIVTLEEVTTTKEHSLLTLLSMIAPSPDWVIGISNVDLLDANEDWITNITIDLYPIDAGTDSGLDYTSGNSNTNPKEPISSLQGIAPFSNEIIGTISIELVEILNTNDFNSVSFEVFPNPTSELLQFRSQQEIERISFYNAVGAKVKTVAVFNNEITVDVVDLMSGFYIAEIAFRNGESQTKRIVKN